MSHSHSAVAWVAALVILIASGVLAEDKPSAEEPQIRTGQAAIEKALAEPIDLEFDEEPLEDVVESLKDHCKIEIVLDVRALGDVGIDTDTPVIANLHALPLRSALNLMLRPLNLTWTIDDNVLLITTPEENEAKMITRVLDVSDLVVCRDKDDEQWDDYDTLINVINSTIRPTTWDQVGGPGSITGASLGTAKVLVVLQTYHIQREIAELLAKIRKVAEKNADGELPQRNKPQDKPARHFMLSNSSGDQPQKEQPPAPDSSKGEGTLK